MYRRLLVSLLAVAFLAMGQQAITVQKLIEFVKSQVQLIKQKRGTDKELALALGSVRLSESSTCRRSKTCRPRAPAH